MKNQILVGVVAIIAIAIITIFTTNFSPSPTGTVVGQAGKSVAKNFESKNMDRGIEGVRKRVEQRPFEDHRIDAFVKYMASLEVRSLAD